MFWKDHSIVYQQTPRTVVDPSLDIVAMEVSVEGTARLRDQDRCDREIIVNQTMLCEVILRISLICMGCVTDPIPIIQHQLVVPHVLG
jgi:hypothetical protein